MVDRLAGKVAIVSGAGSSGDGIGNGKATAVLFAREGARVLCADRAIERAEETVAMIRDEGGVASALQADVTSVEDVEAMRDAAHDAFGPVDVLVNNAGINQDVRFREMSHEQWDTVLDVHLDGAFHCTQAFFDDLAEAEANLDAMPGYEFDVALTSQGSAALADASAQFER